MPKKKIESNLGMLLAAFAVLLIVVFSANYLSQSPAQALPGEGGDIPPENLPGAQAISDAPAKVIASEEIAQSAAENYEKGNFQLSSELYSQSLQHYIENNDSSNARESYYGMLRSMRVAYEFTHDLETAENLMHDSFPSMPQSQVQAWMDDERNYLLDGGERKYLGGIVANAYYRDLSLMHERMEKENENMFFDQVHSVVFSNEITAGSPYSNPTRYNAAGSLYIERSQLPQEGVLKLWLPLPIETDAQCDVEIISIEPSRYVVGNPVIEGDIGYAYMEVPLDSLADGLNITEIVRFTSYEQRFSIDPSNVGQYDMDSELYLKFTSLKGNTIATTEMRELAASIAGGEENPYLAARKIYEYVISNITYSAMPHLMFWERGIPESKYAHENRIGDCGTQSMYFSALCRALGIPARSQGGYQMVPTLQGTHFWAQVYLPNYGWIPVDTTIAETADWGFNISDDEGRQFKDFYFGSLDGYRFVIQNDVDLPLDPAPDVSNLMKAVLQSPAVTGPTGMSDVPAIVSTAWKFNITAT